MSFRPGIFFWFRQAQRGKRGQIAPFLIIIIVILIIASMVMVYTGKVGTQKIQVSNAADAGALAGAASLATVLNQMAYMNIAMQQINAVLMALFAIPMPLKAECGWKISIPGLDKIFKGGVSLLSNGKYGVYEWAVYFFLSMYGNMWLMGIRAKDPARARSFRYAFNNAGIQEAEKRVPGQERGSHPTRRKDVGLGQWMKDHKDDLLSAGSLTYTWDMYYQDVEQSGEQMTYTGVPIPGNEVTVSVADIPDVFGVVPVPFAYVGFYYEYQPEVTCGCFPCGEAPPFYTHVPFLCTQKQQLLPACQPQVGIEESIKKANTRTLSIGGIPIPGAATTPATNITPVIHPIPDHWQSSGCDGCGIHPGGCRGTCGTTWWGMVTYIVPVAFVAAVSPTDPQVRVNVSRKEPARNLGLYGMKATEVTAESVAEVYGGSINSETFRVRLKEAR